MPLVVGHSAEETKLQMACFQYVTHAQRLGTRIASSFRRGLFISHPLRLSALFTR